VKIVLKEHVINDKIPLIKAWGWNVTPAKIRQTVKKPKWRGISRFGQPTAMSSLDEKHILRVIFEVRGDIIEVITIHPARIGTYESTKQD